MLHPAILYQKNNLSLEQNFLQIMLLLDVINKLKNVRDNKGFSCLILKDLSKAFDTVNHRWAVPRYRYRGTFLVPVPSLLLWYQYRYCGTLVFFGGTGTLVLFYFLVGILRP